MRGIEVTPAVLACIWMLSSTAMGADIPGRGDALSHFSIDSRQRGFNSSNPTAATNQAGSFKLKNPQTPTAMTVSGKFRYYLKSTYGPMSIAFSLAGAGINQARDSVPEWGQGMEGYGKRFGSSFGQKAVKRSIQFGVGVMLGEDPRYFVSGRSGIWQRTLYAAGQTFVSHKDSEGIRPAYSHFMGVIGGVYVSRQWYPDPDRRTEKYASAFAISLGLDMAKNIFNEFWPDVKRMLSH